MFSNPVSTRSLRSVLSGTTAAMGLALVVMMSASPSTAQVEISTSIGGNFGGVVTFSADGGSLDGDYDGGVFWKTDLLYFVSEYFGVGPYLTVATAGSDSEDVTLAEGGITLAPRIPFYDAVGDVDLLFTPKLSIGGRGLVSSADGVPDSNGLAINFGVDLRAQFNSGLALFVEPGFVTQPAGGNSDYNVTWGPIGYFTVGMGYRF